MIGWWLLACAGAEPERPATGPAPEPAPSAPVPTLPALGASIAPAQIFPIDRPRCAATAEPATFEWTVNGQPAGSGAVLEAALAVGDALTCTASADGATASVRATVQAAPVPGNVLLVIADDVGVDKLAAYGLGSEVAPTPTIDALAATGIVFRQAFTNPLCSSSRAQIQTGRLAWRTGMTSAVAWGSWWSLQDDEVTLGTLFTSHGHDAAYVGKWHLATKAFDGATHPNRLGYPYYAGSLIGFTADSSSDGLGQSYFDWEKVVNGVPARTDVYATTANADDAIAWLATAREPWLLVVAFNAAHEPSHWPPESLGLTAGGSTEALEQVHRMIEGLDHELGRIAAAVPPDAAARTTTIVVGDNGTFSEVMAPNLPGELGKKSPYELGSRMPLIVAGPMVGVPGSTSDALVSSTDLFLTVAGLAGIPVSEADRAELDSIDLMPVLRDPTAASGREYVVTAELKQPGLGPWDSGWQTIRDARWKLVEYVDGTQELYDLEGRWYEDVDLMAEPLSPDLEAIRARLEAALPIALPESWTGEG